MIRKDSERSRARPLAVEATPEPAFVPAWPPAETELDRWITPRAARFDPAAGLLAVPVQSHGYHTSLPSGGMAHGTRASAEYAERILLRGDPQDGEQAGRIIMALARCQVSDPADELAGLWPYYAQEPVAQMTPPDLNWADFCGAALATMLISHAGKLTAEARTQGTEALVRAAGLIRRRDVGPHYTNIAVLGGVVVAAAARLTGDAGLAAYARGRLERIADAFERDGVSEYNSPVYAIVVVEACETGLHLVTDEPTRAALGRVLEGIWLHLAAHFHLPTRQSAGPISRTYADRVPASFVSALAWRTGLVALPENAKPAVPSVPPLRCSDQVVRLLSRRFERPETERIRYGGSALTGVRDTATGAVWRSATACLGSADYATTYFQSRPVLGFWQGAADEPVMVRLRVTSAGNDFGAACVLSDQADSHVLFAVQLATNRGDHHPRLSLSPDGVYDVTDLQAEVFVEGRNLQGFSRENERGETWLGVSDGLHEVRLLPVPPALGTTKRAWAVHTHEAGVSLVCRILPGGHKLAIGEMPPLQLAAALSLTTPDAPQQTHPTAGGMTTETGETQGREETRQITWMVDDEGRKVLKVDVPVRAFLY